MSPAAVGTIAILTAATLRKNFKNRAWILAGVVGALLGGMLFKLIQGQL